jgi:lipopolysaccharide transport system permease protein
MTGRGKRRTSELWWTLVERQIRLRAKRTLFGALWPAFSPFLLLALYVFVFHSVFRVPVRRYPVYLFAGLLPWTFLAQTLAQGPTAISNDPDLVRRAPFRYEILPLSLVGVMAVYFIATLTMFVAYLAIKGELVWKMLLFLPLPVIALSLFIGGVVMILSVVDVYTRDVRLVLGNIITVWFFLVPIVYRPAMAKGAVRSLRRVDPMNMLVGVFRDVLYQGHLSRPLNTVLIVFICAAFFVVCLAIFRHFAVNLPRDV